MQLITDFSLITTPFTNSVITLGNFDGIHIGHQELVRMIIRRAKELGGKSMVVTFRPHPLKILAPDKCPPLISIYEEKIRILEKLGIDVIVKIPFSLEFASMSPRDFVENILCGLLGAREIFVGYNYRFGKGREGTTDTLKEMGEEFGFVVNEVEQISFNGVAVSSTAIRQLLKDGKVEDAADLLGRPYALVGIVVHGDGRGKQLGFPTANIVSKHMIIPSDGVYAVKVAARDRCYDGVVNIGSRPTFDTHTLAIEVHLFNFDEDLYGEEVTVFFLKKIREEKKFDSAAALINQIGIDIKEAKTVLAMNPDCVDLTL